MQCRGRWGWGALFRALDTRVKSRFFVRVPPYSFLIYLLSLSLVVSPATIAAATVAIAAAFASAKLYV